MKEFLKGFAGSLMAAIVVIGYFEYTAHRNFERQEAQLSKMLDTAVGACGAP